VQAGQDRLGEIRRIFGVATAKGVAQDELNALAGLGGVPVPGQEDQAGEEPVEGVSANEATNLLALFDPNDAHGGVE
jgi:hypothetical protein